jgi:catechol 2,3-dioxygenase-like lactoylglutathione lyase family enzyme
MKLRVRRVILFTQDVPALAAFYREVLGLRGLSDPDNRGWIELDAGRIGLAIHKGRPPAVRSSGPKLAFLCPDVVAARAKLVERGAKLGPVKGSAGGLQLCDGRDPAGYPASFPTVPKRCLVRSPANPVQR